MITADCGVTMVEAILPISTLIVALVALIVAISALKRDKEEERKSKIIQGVKSRVELTTIANDLRADCRFQILQIEKRIQTYKECANHDWENSESYGKLMEMEEATANKLNSLMNSADEISSRKFTNIHEVSVEELCELHIEIGHLKQTKTNILNAARAGSEG